MGFSVLRRVTIPPVSIRFLPGCETAFVSVSALWRITPSQWLSRVTPSLQMVQQRALCSCWPGRIPLSDMDLD